MKRVLLVGAVLAAGVTRGAHAQTYDPDDPGSGSPLVLLEVPGDGPAYYAQRERARELLRRQSHSEAEPLLEQLARDYPRDFENWNSLAEVKEALKKYAEAAAAYEKAGALWGWDAGYQFGYYAAANHLRAGNKRAALDLLHRLVLEQHGINRASLFMRPEFEALRSDPEFLQLVGRVDTRGWDRTRGWRHDIDFLKREVKRVNPEYRDKALPAEFTRRYEELRRNVAKRSDEENFYGMLRMLAALRQGHVVLFVPPGARMPIRYLPVRFYAFPEGIFIVDGVAAGAELVGSRVLSVGTMPAEEGLRRIAQATSADGQMEWVWSAARLGETTYLKGMGAIDRIDELEVTVEDAAGKQRKVRLATLPKPMEARVDKLVPPKGVAAPLFLSNMQKTFWEQPLPEHDALYVQVNNLKDGQGETLEQYGERLWTVLEKRRPRNLILDLRHNNGGSTHLYPSLLRSLIAFSRTPGHQLYVLIGRRTYSAAGNFVTDLERLADPLFVGEATSECCSLYGDPTFVALPYSGVLGELTAYKWQLTFPGDRRREMSPEVPVQLTAKAYFAGKDPVLEAALRMVAQQRQAKAGGSTPGD
jgi:tetratricopeptide (TPR) repeat protein